VKEAEAGDAPADELLGVAEFESEFFCGPLHQDPEREFYKHLGSLPIFTWGGLGRALLNPLRAKRELDELGERLKSRGIEGNMRGDGLTKGGILVISPEDEILYTFPEDPGKGVPEAECAKIVAAVRSLSATKAEGP